MLSFDVVLGMAHRASHMPGYTNKLSAQPTLMFILNQGLPVLLRQVLKRWPSCFSVPNSWAYRDTPPLPVTEFFNPYTVLQNSLWWCSLEGLALWMASCIKPMTNTSLVALLSSCKPVARMVFKASW